VVRLSIVFLPMVPVPPTSTLFPYTTLFRSSSAAPAPAGPRGDSDPSPASPRYNLRRARHGGDRGQCGDRRRAADRARALRTSPRSEEHTSELQSPCNLVCRLLLEKKKKSK